MTLPASQPATQNINLRNNGTDRLERYFNFLRKKASKTENGKIFYYGKFLRGLSAGDVEKLITIRTRERKCLAVSLENRSEARNGWKLPQTRQSKRTRKRNLCTPPDIEIFPFSSAQRIFINIINVIYSFSLHSQFPSP